MTTEIDPEEHEYSYINDGYRYTDTPDNVSHYEHLQKNRKGNAKHRVETSTRIQPLHIDDAPTGSGRSAGCKCPPWWVWLLVIIGLVIIGGLAAVLVYLFHILPHLGTQDSSLHTTARTSVSPDVPRPPATSNAYTTDKPITTPVSSVYRTSTSAPNTDCESLYNAGNRVSGVYTISPNGVRQMTVYCEQRLDGGGWTVFQRIQNGDVTFERNWNDFKNGFGDAGSNFWLGNDNIHTLTAGQDQKLKIEMEYPAGNMVYADYAHFAIADESDKYRLFLSGFSTSSNITDQLAYHNGSPFSTEDQDNDRSRAHCAQLNSGGWWYNDCAFVKLNGRYNPRNQYETIRWHGLTPTGKSMVSVRMMVKGAP